MKRIILSLCILTLILTACSTDDLSAYKKAVAMTNSIPSGIQHMKLKLDLDMNTEGLSYDVVQQLSYFQHMEYANDIQYSNTEDNAGVIVKNYSNFGGFGMDFNIYIQEDQIYMELPMDNGYVNLKEVQEGSQNGIDEGYFSEEVITPVITKWNELLGQEDVLKQEKTYILTDDGQIKTTIYSIHAGEEQLKTLMEEMIRIVKEEGLFDNVLENGVNIEEVDLEGVNLEEKIEEFLDRIVLVSFDGKAYVDYDGRMVRSDFGVQCSLPGAKPGEPTRFDITFEVEYDHLGEEMKFDFPTVEEDEWVDINDEDFYENMFQ